jgi:hypothetical protein
MSWPRTVIACTYVDCRWLEPPMRDAAAKPTCPIHGTPLMLVSVVPYSIPAVDQPGLSAEQIIEGVS